MNQSFSGQTLKCEEPHRWQFVKVRYIWYIQVSNLLENMYYVIIIVFVQSSFVFQGE